MSVVVCTPDMAGDHSMARVGDPLALPRGEMVMAPERAAMVMMGLMGWHPKFWGGQDPIALLMENIEAEVEIMNDGGPWWIHVGSWGPTGAITTHEFPDHPSVGWMWAGQFTAGRWVRVDIVGSPSNPKGARVRWDTGTGRPSWFIGRALVWAAG